MGLYPHEDFTWLEGGRLQLVYNDFSGKVTTTIYEPILVIEKRDNCFYCSCSEREGDDAACRNHGYYGQRPCEEHDMPGANWDSQDGTDSGEMPTSVQYKRFFDRWAAERWAKLDPRCIGKTIRDRVCELEYPHSHWPKENNHG